MAWSRKVVLATDTLLSLRNPVKNGANQLSRFDYLHDTLFDPNQHYCQKGASCLRGNLCYRRPIADW